MNSQGIFFEKLTKTSVKLALEFDNRTLEEGGQIDCIMLDFSKAFDKVPHKRLLHKLHYYGVRGETLNWIQAFLSSRTQTVLVNGKQSKQAPVLSGVPQGTVLGPLLFLAYINDMPECVSSDLRLFADDSLLYRRIKSAEYATILQQDLDKLQEWESKWLMQFHPEKCFTLRVTNKTKPLKSNYTIHGHTLLSAIDLLLTEIPTEESQTRGRSIWKSHPKYCKVPRSIHQREAFMESPRLRSNKEGNQYTLVSPQKHSFMPEACERILLQSLHSTTTGVCLNSLDTSHTVKHQSAGNGAT